jgi:hypothetical protein
MARAIFSYRGSTISFAKASDYTRDYPVYDVMVDGTAVGSISKGWTQIGGNGWAGAVVGRTRSNRKDAAVDLIRELHIL